MWYINLNSYVLSRYYVISNFTTHFGGIELDKNNSTSEEKLESAVKELAVLIDRSRLREYVDLMSSPKRLIYANFIAGMARGFGVAVGVTVIAAVAVYVLKGFVDLPLIGKIIAKLIDIVEANR